MVKPSIKKFYESEYNSDPYALLDDACIDICNWAAGFDVDLNAIFSDIKLITSGCDRFTSYASYKKMNSALPKSLKSKATLTSSIRTTKGGMQYPFLGLIIKGPMETVWNGYEYLTEQFERHCASQLTADQTAAANKRQEEKKQRLITARKEREAKHAKQEEEKAAERARDIAWLENYHAMFDAAPAEMGTGAYFAKKKIGDIAWLSNVKRVTDDRVGLHTAIPFTKLTGANRGTAVSYQRILDTPLNIQGKVTGKLTTKTVEDNALKGAVHVFGELVNGKRIMVGEGYATVASAMLAKNAQCGVMAYSTNNMKTVVDVLRSNYPESEIFVLVDNDHDTCKQGKGNAGMLSANAILTKHHNSGKVKAYVPVFDGMSEESKQTCSDFNDVHCVLGLDIVSKQIGAKANRIDWDISALDKQLFKLRYVSNANINKQIKHCVFTGMMQVPMMLSAEDLFNIIKNELQRLQVRRTNLNITPAIKYLFNAIQRGDAIHTNRAMAFRSFSSRITDKANRPKHVNYVQFKQWQVNDEIVNFVRGCTGPVILRAGMGSRKSSKALRTLMREADRGILTGHRQTLTWDLFRTMADAKDYDALGRDKDVLHYQDEGATEAAPYAKKLVCCVNSIIKGIFRPLVKEHDFMAMDEATQTIRSVLTGGAMAYPVDVYNMMKTALAATTERVVLCDADANDHLITLLERANAMREEMGLEPWPQINVIDLPVNVEVVNEDKTRSKIRVNFTDPNSTFLRIQQAIEDGKRCLVATDSTRYAEQVREFVRMHNDTTLKGKRQLRVLYVSQDTKPELAVQAFQDNPEKVAKDYDILIYSPAISSGVSIDVRHFECHFGVFYGEIVPSDAIQMLRRDRTATEFTLGLGQMNNRRETDLRRMVRGLVAVTKDTSCKMNFEDGTFNLGTHDTEFNRARMEMMIEENRARADFSNQILRILDADGYAVNRLDTSEIDIAQGKEERKFLQGFIEERKKNLHLDSVTPNEQRLEELKEQQNLSEAERAELNRWDIENVLCDEVTSYSYDFWLDGGIKKAARFELLRMTQAEAENVDDLERRTEFSYQIKLPHDEYPQTFSFKAHEESEALTELHRQFAGIRIDSVEPDAQEGVFTCSIMHNGSSVTRRVVASSDRCARAWLFANYFDAEILASTKTPVVEVSKRQYLGETRKLLVQYLLTCGIDVENGEGMATQEGMKAAMEQLTATETQRDVFNNVATLFGGRIEKGQKKRAADMFKLVCEQLGLEAVKGRATRSQGRAVYWTIVQRDWASMEARNERRKAAKVTAYELEALENTSLNVIHDVLGTYIYNENVVDHLDPSENTPSHSFDQLLNTAAKLVDLPLSWAQTLFTSEEQSIFTSGKMNLRHLCMALRDIFMQERGHELNAGQFERLRNWQPGSV